MGPEYWLSAKTNEIYAHMSRGSLRCVQTLVCSRMSHECPQYIYILLYLGISDTKDAFFYFSYQETKPFSPSILSVSTGWGAMGLWSFTSTQSR